MEVNIYNNISNENANNINLESNRDIEDINNKKKEDKSSNKLLTFIKNKPLIFSLIIIGICAIIIVAITIPLVLINKNKDKKDENSSNNNQNEVPTINEIDSTKQFDFSDIDINEKYVGIGGNSNNLDNFCNYLSGISNDLEDKEKVYLIYKWVANNIQYDYDSYIAHNDVSSEPADVLSSKKGVCSGYSGLFTKLLTCLSFPAENIKNIIGHSKGLGFNYEDTISDENTDHEWNAVKINNKWCLIDTTWGAGSIIEGAFVQSYDEYYLCTPPAQFVRSHLPKKVEENLQFLDKPIDINTFQNMAYTTKYFFEYGFNGLSNDQMVQNICGDGKMTLKYNNDIRPVLLVKVKKDGNEYNDWVMEKKIANGYDIIVYINEEGNYDVDISANIDKSNNYVGILNYKIKCNSAPNTKKYFPEFKPDYKKDDNIELISPLEKELMQGQKYNFVINSGNYDKLYLLLGFDIYYEIVEMDKEGITFKENNLMIHGDFVSINYKTSAGRYFSLVEYTTTGEDIYFPQTFETPFKKVLESPLKESLKYGDTYNFKIICDTTYSIKIYYGNNNWHDLDKNGNIYTKEITINGDMTDSPNELYIVYGPNDDSEYESMYSYDIE